MKQNQFYRTTASGCTMLHRKFHSVIYNFLTFYEIAKINLNLGKLFLVLKINYMKKIKNFGSYLFTHFTLYKCQCNVSEITIHSYYKEEDGIRCIKDEVLKTIYPFLSSHSLLRVSRRKINHNYSI